MRPNAATTVAAKRASASRSVTSTAARTGASDEHDVPVVRRRAACGRPGRGGGGRTGRVHARAGEVQRPGPRPGPGWRPVTTATRPARPCRRRSGTAVGGRRRAPRRRVGGRPVRGRRRDQRVEGALVHPLLGVPLHAEDEAGRRAARPPRSRRRRLAAVGDEAAAEVGDGLVVRAAHRRRGAEDRRRRPSPARSRPRRRRTRRGRVRCASVPDHVGQVLVQRAARAPR